MRHTPASAKKANDQCNSCHAVEGLRIHDAARGRTLELSIDPDIYGASLHGLVECTACHDRGHDHFPHTGPIFYPRFLCVDCHAKLDDLQGLALGVRRDELMGGVHGREAEFRYDCHLCHNPHSFKLVREQEAALGRIASSNHICLSCHEPEGEMAGRFKELPDTRERHGLFPNAELHMRKVKCITCHTPKQSRTRHDVLPANKSVKECTQCHSRESGLLANTYADLRHADAAVPLSEVPQAPDDGVRDNVYVVGSTRSALLDKLSIAGFLFMLLLVGAHALARATVRKRHKKRAD